MMQFWRWVLFRLEALVTERHMWLRYQLNKKKYQKTQMWVKKGGKLLTPQVYEQVLQFVRQTVNISPRPYGKGAYGLKIAAVWEDAEGDHGDDWQTDFLYSDREVAYARLKERMETWHRPPDAIMVGILPYGELARGL